ncbi:SIS domain-containing protein [Enterococcus mediterraneensis]|uniref:SIS domain-containing protein n=1 Tax=Enterococcus mediterraneensis TaxID=2364791 RepID=UPI000F06C8FB|nr:SIS domain-containing protein [Enterococcus mediterraneensis]
MSLAYFDYCEELAVVLRKEEPKMREAGKRIAVAIANGGILQAFGSGHSHAGAIEISGRAGGLIPTKAIIDPANGMYESIEGVGNLLAKKVQIKEYDIFVIISNSGRNPEVIELAKWVKDHGNDLIVVTALDISEKSTSRHSSGMRLFELADVILDNHSVFGDAALTIDGLDTPVCGTSSYAATLLLQQTMHFAINELVTQGIKPPVYKSANIDGGREENDYWEKKYADRIFHM